MKHTFIDVLTKTQTEMQEWLPEVLADYGYQIKVTDYMIQAISSEENQPCLVAHLDTINTKRKNYSYGSYYSNGSTLSTEKDRTPEVQDILVTEHYILLSPERKSSIQCLGADDRVGVKTILDILEMGLRPHILFTTDEEVGCVGSRKAVEENALEGLKMASMLIQIDRGVHERSWHEMVTYDFDPESHKEIFDELRKTYTMATGSYTDVAVLGPHLDKPIVNVSASYRHEHTTDEFINLDAYEYNTQGLIKFIKWVVKQDTSEWKYVAKYVPPKPTYTRTSNLANFAPKFGEARPSLWVKGKGYGKAEDYLTEMCKSQFMKPKDIFNRFIDEGYDEEDLIDCLDLAYSLGAEFTNVWQLNYILEGKIYEHVE
mgnify:FL=1